MAQTSPMEQTGKRLVFEDSIEVQAPLQEVYNRWSDFTRFPEFMSNVEQVRPVGDNRYHWVARIFGIPQEWDAEITEREQNNRITWRSVNGTYNSGTARFSDLSNGRTQVRLRLEYTPPAGKAGEVLDNLTRTTQREVREDLENFRRTLTGESGSRSLMSSLSDAMDIEPNEHTDMQRILGSLATVISFGVIGAEISKLVNDATAKVDVSNPASLLTAPTGYMVGKALGVARTPLPFSTGQSLQSKWASNFWGILCGGSILASAILRFQGRKRDALFVGQWAPTFMGLGSLSRMIGDNGIKTSSLASEASWAFASGGLGAILCSLFWHARGYYKDGQFVGQWGPTLMIAAALARIYRRG